MARTAPIPKLDLSIDELFIIINALGTDIVSDNIRKKMIEQYDYKIHKYAHPEDVMAAYKRTVEKFGPMFERLAKE